jgi:hypothetical protein
MEIEMISCLEQAVSTLNHELLRIKKDHKLEKKELLIELDDYQQ